jgi:hypothetical protein
MRPEWQNKGTLPPTRNHSTSPPHSRTAWRAVMCLLTLAGSLAAVHGQTFVFGNISGTWSPDGSPYIATADCTVPSGETLIIQPGVVVQITTGRTINNNGRIQAIGLPNSRITFQSDAASYWNTIANNYSGSTNIFRYCDFQDAQTALTFQVQDGATMFGEIINCTFSNCLQQGLLLGAGGATLNTVIKNNRFDNTGSGCVVSTGWYWTWQSGVVNAVITANIFQNLSGAALRNVVGDGSGDSSAALVNNSLVNCRIGVSAQDPLNAQMQNNIFIGCTNAAMVSGSMSRLASYNCFYGNATNFTGYEPAYGLTNRVNRNGTLADALYNIYADPLFTDWANFFLRTNSPCVNASASGHAYQNVCLPPSIGTSYGDIGAYGGPDACGWGITIPPPPTNSIQIVIQPQDQAGCRSHSANFTVSATGIGSLNYQWYFNTNNVITNATSASLTLTNLQAMHAGMYSVTVSDQNGPTNSRYARLTVHDPYTELEPQWYFDTYMVAGLYIGGQPGSNYVLKYTEDLSNSNWASWTPLKTNRVDSSGWWFFVDEESPFSPKRFYQARPLP